MKQQRGYSLLEVIIAFALLALALSLLLGSLAGAARQVRQSEDYGRAALHAQSLLAEVGMGEPLMVGQQHGQWEQGRYRWQLQIEPFVEPGVAPASVSRLPLLQLTLQVTWGDAAVPQLQWRSLRLLPPDIGGAAP